MVRFKTILPLAFLMFFTACVGTVENKNAIKTETAKTAVPSLSFAGITAAIPVSDSKVDVYFNAGPGNPADLKYQIFVNDSKNPIEVSGNKIVPSLVRPGEFKYTVENLRVNTNYAFSVGLKDAKSGLVSNVNKSLSAQTFINLTAKFNGVLSAKPLAGSLGTTRIELKWIPASISGGILGAMPEDPIAYRIQYIEAGLGSPVDLINETNPNIVTYISDATDATLIKTGTSPKLLKNLKKSINSTTSVVIPDLLPATKYYFLVRAIHTAYIDYRLLDGYKFEENLNVVEVETLEPAAPVTWNETSVVASTVLEDATLSKKNLNWDPATGPFKNYRIYVRALGATNNPVTSPDITGIDNAINNGTAMPANNFGYVISPDQPYFQLTGLTAYQYYNVIVATCLSDLCNTNDYKIVSPIGNFQVIPTIAPFFGLVKIENPTSSTTLNKISLKFDPPVMSAGFLTDIEVYCMPSATANPTTDSLLLDTGIKSSLVTGSENCKGLRRNTTTPVNLTTFSSIEIEADATKPFLLAGMELSGLEYCFSVIPVIKNGATVIYRDKANMITKCSYIQKKLPTILEFPGSKKICSELNSSSLVVNWDKPTSGIYNGYSVFWRKNTGGPFQFSEAIANPTTIVNPTMPFTVEAGRYYRQDITNPNTVTFTIQGLEAGSRYQYGVLAHDKQGALFNYSEINTNVNDCSIGLPVANFNEWVEIFAVGPKEDGRNSYTSKGYRSNFVTETVNDYGQPVEVGIDSDGNLTPDHIDQFGNMLDTTFNGAYGMPDNNPAKGKRMYSNQGIVRIAWKDISFSGGGSLNDAITAYDKIRNGVPVTKPNRKYGYHVYRSSDNQETWTKLTGDADIQTADNLGLLHPTPYYEWKRSNDGFMSGTSNATQAYFDGTGTKKFNGVIFTDYSVVASQPTDASQTVARARVYHYKVVPVVNGIEVKLANGPAGSVVPQNIIKVVLPPANMSFVSRLIANRQTCLELGRNPSKDVSTFYSCSYDGVGSRTLTNPAVKGDSVFVFDIGKDFMIDRFEIGCNMTRGSSDPTKSTFTGTYLDEFTGDADSGDKFEGCYFDQEDSEFLHGYNASVSTLVLGDGVDRESTAPASYSSTRQFRKGDCFSHSTKSIKSGNYQFMVNYPGIYGAAVTDSTKFEDFFTVYSDDTSKIAGYAAQSEYAAVHFNVARPLSSHWYPNTVEMQARDGNAANKIRIKRKFRGEAACSVNLPVQASNNKIKPRWIPVNSLGNLQLVDGDGVSPATPIDFSLLTKTMGEIKDVNDANNYLYDNVENKVPASNKTPANPYRYNDSTKLARVVTSNAAKLPPIVGLDQKSAQEICSTYEVEIGYEDGGAWTKLKDKSSKRLMRRSEGIIAGAWPNYFKEGAANRNVDGFGNVSSIIPETNRPAISPTPPVAEKIPPLVDAVRVEQGYPYSQLTSGTPTVTRPANAFNNACNSAERANIAAITAADIIPGNLIKTNIYMADAGNNISYFLSGSSYFDNDSATAVAADYDSNTQLCVSKFGLQDLVGNARELSGEKIFCNADAINNGAKIGLFNANATTESDPHIDGENLWYRKDLVTAKGYISDPALADDVGSCSVVNARARDIASDQAQMFSDGSSIFRTLYDLWGNFSSLVSAMFRNNEDPKVIEGLRSGDGYFLDFGKTGIGAELLHGNELSLFNNPNLGNVSPFFSPVIGLPIKCPDEVCGTPLTPPVSDNKKVSTATLNTSGASLDVGNFPIGNSQFRSDGMLSVGDWDLYNLPGSYPNATLENVVISIVRPGAGADYGAVADYVTASDGPFQVARPYWSTDYEEPFRMLNFGSVIESGSGRYAGGLYGDVLYEEHHRKAAARCAITIE